MRKIEAREIVDALEKSAILEVVLNDDVGDGVENELNVAGVGGASEMRVDLFLFLALVQILELELNVGGRILERVGSCKTKRDDCLFTDE